jgi:hypothetical protein
MSLVKDKRDGDALLEESFLAGKEMLRKLGWESDNAMVIFQAVDSGDSLIGKAHHWEKSIILFKVFTKFELLEVEVSITFLATECFSLHSDRYLLRPVVKI